MLASCPAANSAETPVSGQQSVQMDCKSRRYESSDRDESTPYIRPDSKKDELSASPTRVKPPGQKQGTLIKWLETSKSVGHFQAGLNGDSGKEVDGGAETSKKKDLVTDTSFKSETSANPASRGIFEATARLFTFEAPIPRNKTSNKEQQTSDGSTWRTGRGVFGTPEHEKQQSSVEIIRQSVESLKPSELFNSSADTPLDRSASDTNQQTSHADEAPLRHEATKLSSLNQSGPEYLSSGPLQPETPVRSLKTGRSPQSAATTSGKQGPQHSKKNQFLSPSALSVDSYSVSSTTPSRCSSKEPTVTRDSEGPDTGEQTPASELSDGSCRSSLCEDEPNSDDDSTCLIPYTPPSRRDHDPNTGAVIPRPSPGAVDGIWIWKWAPRRQKLCVDYWVWKGVCRNLTKVEQSAGYIYAFQVTDPQGNDYVKIGKSKTVDARMRDHQVCYGDCTRIYPPQGESAVRVSHHARVEKLIHSELVMRAVWMDLCPKNQVKHKTHREWFDVKQQHAIAVITKWSHWMNNSPYEEIVLTEEEIEAKRKTKAKGKEAKGKEAKGKEAKGKEAKLEKKSEIHKSQGISASKVWQLKPMDPNDLRNICLPLRYEDSEDVEARMNRSSSTLVVQSD
jgi:T5orf172 domain